MKPTQVVVPLLEGFEEIEAVTIIDVLRRADIRVVIAGTTPGPVRGSHGISVVAERALADIAADDVTMIALPGGMPGAERLARDSEVQRLLAQVSARDDGYAAAICAAPMALAAAGVHAGRVVTSYPGFDRHLEGAKHYAEDRVVVDGRVVTSRGPGTALEFALTLVGMLAGVEAEARLQAAMLVVRPAAARTVA